MGVTKTVQTVCKELQSKYSAHTILLYGSRANGTASADSDLDIAAFGPVSSMVRVAHLRDDIYVDGFLYPEGVLSNPSEEHLRFVGAKILLQKNRMAESFLSSLEALYLAGPTPLPQDELEARRAWMRKMLLRVRRGDTEGHYRRVWLLTVMLEDYFHLRQRWFEGPKKAFAWLQEHDPKTFSAFESALKPNADIETIEVAVGHVLDA